MELVGKAESRRYLRRKDAAQYLGICEKTLDRLAKEGILKTIRLHRAGRATCRTVLYDRQDLDAFMAAAKT